MSDLSVRLFGLTTVAQEGESVTPSFDPKSLPKQPRVFSKYVTVGIRLVREGCFVCCALARQAAFQ